MHQEEQVLGRREAEAGNNRRNEMLSEKQRTWVLSYNYTYTKLTCSLCIIYLLKKLTFNSLFRKRLNINRGVAKSVVAYPYYAAVD